MSGSIKSKPLFAGSTKGTVEQNRVLPKPGEITRYILTSAQNNTKINEEVWSNLRALAKHYNATILVGTFTYNKNSYSQMSVKKGTHTGYEKDLWYDPTITPYIRDERVGLANGLMWAGEMNIQPTADDPLLGLSTYGGRSSVIFPHAKIRLESVAAMKGHHAKFMYTTGTVTKRNYIKKKAGLKAEQHHAYGGLLVEVNSEGNWWVRQLEADRKNRIYDLIIKANKGRITQGKVEAITWGDFHATRIDPTVHHAAVDPGEMLDTLKPRKQFMHDLFDGESVNHHANNDPHEQYNTFIRGFDDVGAELKLTAELLHTYHREYTRAFVVFSNHDNRILRWLKEHDYRKDARNAALFLELQRRLYKAIEKGDKNFNMIEYALRRFNPPHIRYLNKDESFTIGKGRIECGMHGHLGPNGSKGTPNNLFKIGKQANTAHTHSAKIINGLYAAGTSSLLDMGYNSGPSSWSHSHILTYRNGKRAIITVFNGKWRS